MIARDFSEIQLDAGRWSLTWFPPDSRPDGKMHGSAGVCFTDEGDICLIRIRGVSYWEFPAGRPEQRETFLDTLKREVLEEACSEVQEQRLIGYLKTKQVGGTTVVRAYYRARIRVLDWDPRHEIEERMFCSAAEVAGYVCADHRPIVLRALIESGVAVGDVDGG